VEPDDGKRRKLAMIRDLLIELGARTVSELAARLAGVELAPANQYRSFCDGEANTNEGARTPAVRSGCCESFDDPGEWVEGADQCRDAGTPRSRSSAS
jgi:hypothetical protein